MTLRDLQSELARLSALHPLTETNIESVEVQNGRVILDEGPSEWERRYAQPDELRKLQLRVQRAIREAQAK